ncbi:MAG: hypothetical protein IH989_05885 [Planctomycetes bacterium]|nr:hypothetical protein [Planctomycetota bacterium]
MPVITQVSTMGDSKQQQNRLLAHDLRAQFRDEQIEQIKAEVREAYAGRLRAAGSRAEKQTIKNEMKAEIDRRTEALRREAELDTPDSI